MAATGDEAVVIPTTDEAGVVVSTATYRGGVLDGPFTAYGQDGQPVLTMSFRDGLAEGVATHLRDGRPESTVTWKAGRLEGELRAFDPAGHVVTIIRYAGGRRNGLMECFAPDGRRLMTAMYVDDRREGAVTEFFDDGGVRRRAAYRGDMPEGETVDFYPSGNPHERRVFEAGVLVKGPEVLPDGPPVAKPSRLARLLGR
jgi:antitoxin component YwqK of YwqJK toxin-antitoxin module